MVLEKEEYDERFCVNQYFHRSEVELFYIIRQSPKFKSIMISFYVYGLFYVSHPWNLYTKIQKSYTYVQNNTVNFDENLELLLFLSQHFVKRGLSIQGLNKFEN